MLIDIKIFVSKKDICWTSVDVNTKHANVDMWNAICLVKRVTSLLVILL